MHSDASDDKEGVQPVSITMPATVPKCHVVIQALPLEVGQLREQMTWLQEWLKVDPATRRSRRHPMAPVETTALSGAPANASGAQKGHPGSYWELLPEAEVDAVHDCAPVETCDCGGIVAMQGKPVRHQVFDIPPVQPEVQEYRLYSGVCIQCNRVDRAMPPAGVPSGRIGPRAGAHRRAGHAHSSDPVQDPRPARADPGPGLQRGRHLAGARQSGCGAECAGG